jgi:hypothetical protein
MVNVEGGQTQRGLTPLWLRNPHNIAFGPPQESSRGCVHLVDTGTDDLPLGQLCFIGNINSPTKSNYQLMASISNQCQSKNDGTWERRVGAGVLIEQGVTKRLDRSLRLFSVVNVNMGAGSTKCPLDFTRGQLHGHGTGDSVNDLVGLIDDHGLMFGKQRQGFRSGDRKHRMIRHHYVCFVCLSSTHIRKTFLGK